MRQTGKALIIGLAATFMVPPAATIVLTAASTEAEAARFVCENYRGHRIPGRFTRREAELVELGGGHCSRRNGGYRPVDPGVGYNQGDISAATNGGVSAKVVHKSIRQAREQFHFGRRVRFLHVTDFKLSGIKNAKYTLVFKKRHKHIRVRVKVNFWTEKIKSLGLI
ncbi:hypothetical protein [Coralliovum pocilloporae]|uniref:hypothetical protein n=1 Tax=Coralliovum pocilloporae TaxID=3066369 RepID=UPI003307A820